MSCVGAAPKVAVIVTNVFGGYTNVQRIKRAGLLHSRPGAPAHRDRGAARGLRRGSVLHGLLLAATICVLGAASAVGPARAAPAASAGCTAPGSDAAAYRIGAGDLLRIAVWNDKELDRTVTVRPDGNISFPLLNDVAAAGLTPMQLQGAMTSGLRRYVSDPQVSVVVQEIRSFQVSVLGQVQHPGRYELQSNSATVLDVLAEAGGFTSFAARTEVRVLRQGPDGTRRIPFHYRKAVSAAPGTADFCVQPGDIIIVP